MSRIPAPWIVEEIAAGYRVLDAAGRHVAYVYAETVAGFDWRLLTHDEARRVAANIAKLPDLLGATPKA